MVLLDLLGRKPISPSRVSYLAGLIWKYMCDGQDPFFMVRSNAILDLTQKKMKIDSNELAPAKSSFYVATTLDLLKTFFYFKGRK